ncbi:MAG TPA: ABC transporter substrate-binding protein [Candidatus Sulfotelmatobacter sp.]|nr:ABC transporter substrate-binding protein [Candidatus Sulfotelmatobacter sp.]
MKRSGWRWRVISVLLTVASAANAATRPQYGGTLRVAMRASPSSLDPAEISEAIGGRNVTALIFDRLVTTGADGRVQGALAESWEISPADQRVQIRLRPNVKFHDGSPLTAEAAAASLRKGNPGWTVTPAGDLVIIEPGVSADELLQVLALPRNAIAKRDSGNNISGTGPFRVADWQAGKKLTLAANEDYWAGRPFLDQIEIEMGRSFRDQMNALESGRAQLVEVAPEQVRRLGAPRYEVLQSSPVELVALRFAGDAASVQQKNVRDALRFSLERHSMHTVLLQGAGQASASLLPLWMSGYAFVFPTEADLARARQLRDQVPGAPSLMIGYDNNDPMARLLAERIALNAKDAGLWVQLNAEGEELRLLRIPLASSNPRTALESLNRQLGLPAIAGKSQSIEDLFSAEQTALASGRVIPLFHLPLAYACAASVRDWAVAPDGSLSLVNAWLKSQQP